MYNTNNETTYNQEEYEAKIHERNKNFHRIKASFLLAEVALSGDSRPPPAGPVNYPLIRQYTFFVLLCLCSDFSSTVILTATVYQQYIMYYTK